MKTKPWVGHVLLGLLICVGFTLALRLALTLAGLVVPGLAETHVSLWHGVIATAWFYIGRERRQSEEHYGSNLIPPWQWKPRALRDAAYPILAAAALAGLFDLANHAAAWAILGAVL